MRREVSLGSSGPWLTIAKIHGPCFWVSAAQAYASLLAGAVVMWHTVRKVPRLFRAQTTLLVAAMALPLVSNAAYLTVPKTFVGVDPTPIAFTLSGALIAIAVARYGLLDLVPAVRSRVVEFMRDGLLVTDAMGRTVDMNPAAERVLATHLGQVLGQGVERILGDAAPLSLEANRTGAAHAEIVLGKE